MVYYGAGTKLTRGDNTPEIYKSVKDNQITAEEIASEGLTAAISWRAYNFSGTDAAACPFWMRTPRSKFRLETLLEDASSCGSRKT